MSFFLNITNQTPLKIFVLTFILALTLTDLSGELTVSMCGDTIRGCSYYWPLSVSADRSYYWGNDLFDYTSVLLADFIFWAVVAFFVVKITNKVFNRPVLASVHMVVFLLVIKELISWTDCWGGEVIGCDAVVLLSAIPAFFIGAFSLSFQEKVKNLLLFFVYTVILEFGATLIKKYNSPVPRHLHDDYVYSSLNTFWQLVAGTAIVSAVSFTVAVILYFTVAKIVTALKKQ